MKFTAFSVALGLCLILFLAAFCLAQVKKPTGERIIMCMIQLEHADAEKLAAVLEPLLSPAGSMVPYQPTNTLIIKDRASVVDQLSIAIKGKPCTSVSQRTDIEADDAKKESHLDQ